MAKFNLNHFLETHNILYRTSGKNCKKGNVVVDCPFCISEGVGDDGQHMGIDPKTGWWGCWRNTNHRGKSFVKIISAVGKISFAEAKDLLGVKDTYSAELEGDFSFDSLGSSPFKIIKQSNEIFNFCKFPDEIMPLTYKHELDPFYDYLESRGFKESEIDDVIEKYDIHYAVEGPFKDRLVFPIKMTGGLTGWTARTIHSWNSLRYRSIEKEISKINVYDSLLNYDDIWESGGGDVLFVTEGPLDAIKVDFYANKYKCRATCLFTKFISEEQGQYLAELAELFNKVIILLDPTEIGDMLKMEGQLSHILNIYVHMLSSTIEDPGAMTARQISSLCRKLI